MSTPSFIQGKNVPLQLSSDDITYKNLVCSQAHELTGDKAATQEDTDCGPATSLAASKWSATFQGVINEAISGASEVSAEQALTWFENETLLYLKTTIGTKTFKISGYITNFATQKATASIMKYTMTFTGNGTASIT